MITTNTQMQQRLREINNTKKFLELLRKQQQEQEMQNGRYFLHQSPLKY